MKKTSFLTLEKAREITAQIPTPFHIYDEAGIRQNARALKEAFAWNPGFKEYFAVKATPNPYIIQILKEEGCGCDCATYAELLLAEAVGVTGHDVMVLGYTGKAIGQALNRLLEQVLDEKLPNEKQALLDFLKAAGGETNLISSSKELRK